MIYAIGDIHGQKAMLDRALALIARDGGEDAKIVFLGDYTDRGPDSRAVVDLLLAGQAQGRNWHMIKGNHDRLFSNFVRYGNGYDPRVASGIHWLNPRLGGDKTLASYGIAGQMVFAPHIEVTLEEFLYCDTPEGRLTPADLQARASAAVPATHLDFLDARPLTLETGDHIFVHAGLRPGIALHDQDPEDLIWIRKDFLDFDHDFGKLVVHGHTALQTPARTQTRVNLDGGAGYGRPLVPVVLEGRQSWTLTEGGRVPLAA